MKPITWNVRVAARPDPDVEQPKPAPKEPTVAEVQEAIEQTFAARWPHLATRATAQRTDR